MLNSVKTAISSGIFSLVILSTTSIAHAGNLKATSGPGVAGEPECKPEWTHCVCMYKPLGNGKVCWNDTLTTGSNNNNNSSQRGTKFTKFDTLQN